MASKLVALKKEAYQRLLSRKTKGKSFSDVVMELTEPKKGNLDRFIGILTDEEAEEIETIVNKSRKELSEGLRKRERVLFGH